MKRPTILGPSPIGQGHSQIAVIGPPTVGDQTRGLCSKLMRETELKVLQ